ncbi:hypothetical protein ABGF48_03220 [Helcococcus bovis]|uniref:hypothetical protein n=1 Tax=Helcococcus bovis TaxID=3153252 RepID=UPI0038BC8E6D
MNTETITLILNGVLVPLLIWGVTELVKYLKTKSKNEKLNDIIDLAGMITKDAVYSTNQKYVETIKKQGNFNKQAHNEAFKMAKNEIMKTLGDGGEMLLKQAVGDINTFLKNKIEKEVVELKK